MDVGVCSSENCGGLSADAALASGTELPTVVVVVGNVIDREFM